MGSRRPRLLSTALIVAFTLSCSLAGPQDGMQVSDTTAEATLRSENRCGDDVCDGPETAQNCPQDCATATEEEGTVVVSARDAGRKGFIVVHCDPQEMLNLHENYDPTFFDYDGDNRYDSNDAWKALMDLIDLADSYGIPLTLQFSPPYIDFLQQPQCDSLISSGRAYPQGAQGTAHTRCLDLVMAWSANGHELSLHHHGPNHDPVKFDGYTNREIYSVAGKRACPGRPNEACSCKNDSCHWCAPPDSPLVCQEYTSEPPPGLVGIDPEWKGPIEGPDSMMALVGNVFGEGAVRSICLNHGDEISDIPLEPDIIYSTQGSGYTNAPTDHPRCIGYDVASQYHSAPKYTWFYSHGFATNQDDLNTVKEVVPEMLTGKEGHVLGLVFHVNNFVRSEVNPDDPRYAHAIRDLFAYLSDPRDGGSGVHIETLSTLMIQAGKTKAPDPCVETCYALDESSQSVRYTIPLSPPRGCP